MGSQSQFSRLPKVILPDDENVVEDRYDDLMGENIQEIDAELGPEDTREASRSLVHIITDETARDDFFEEKPEKQQIFGEIKGMTEVNDDEEQADQEKEERKSVTIFQSEAVEEVESKQQESLTVSTEPQEDLATPKQSIEKQVPEQNEETKYPDTEPQKSLLPENMATEPLQQEDSQEVKREDRIEMNFSTPGQSISGASMRLSTAPSIDAGKYATRRSIFYDIEGRIESADQDDLSQFFNIGKLDDIVLVDDHPESAEEEYVPSIIEEEAPSLDRQLYYAKYCSLGNELANNRLKNNVLQKIVIMYLKRRKVENIYKESEPPLDQTRKYGQKLDAYQQLMQINKTERLSAAAEVNDLRSKRAATDNELIKTFNAMQNRESVIGHGLIYSKTGNPIPDKLVERLIRRQSNQIEQVSTMRLKFIKLKGMVQEKLDAINNLDNLENNLHLADYEQLKSDNRSYADKIEERDEELTRLRSKCQNTIQILAHMREKSAALDADLGDLRDEFYSTDNMAKEYRENLADIKHTRDRYRLLARNIKEESGLLTKTDLLKDMEESNTEMKALEIELTKCQEEVKNKKETVRKLRKNIEELAEEINRRKFERQRRGTFLKVDAKKKSKPKPSADVSKDRLVYKQRPTLYLPIIQQGAFKDLVKIRPTPTVLNRKK